MKRSNYLRLFIVVVATSASLLLLSYVHTRTARTEDQNCENGKCPSAGKARTEVILWESLTRNLLSANR
jgi:hypothetical protein